MLLFGIGSVWVRPLLPIDETRYTGVAWEMWVRGDFLVPRINGEVYAHKPPLLFWLMQLGWKLFGVNSWTPRLLSTLFACASLFLIVKIARLLWPESPRPGAFAPLILLSMPLWIFFSSMTSFDVLLSFFTLLTHMGWLLGWKAGRKHAFLLAALGIGGGILAKGPVILLHTVPVLFLCRFWLRGRDARAGRLAAWSVLAILGGACIALAWAIPAGIAGGAEYREQIFHSQTTGRILNSFAHRQPWWCYVPLLPAFAFPLFLFRCFWKRDAASDPGSIYTLAWALAALAGFSFVSGKQVYYLVPELPALALWFAHKLDLTALPDSGRTPLALSMRVTGGIYALIGAVLLLVPSLPLRLPDWAAHISPLWGSLVIAAAIFLLLPVSRSGLSFARLPVVTTLVLLFVHTAIFTAARPTYDLEPAARKIAALQQAGHPVAFVGTYHAQFQFPGRLRKPLLQLGSPEEALDWAKTNLNGALVTICQKKGDPPGDVLVHIQPYRGQRLAIWSTDAAAAHSKKFLDLVR